MKQIKIMLSVFIIIFISIFGCNTTTNDSGINSDAKSMLWGDLKAGNYDIGFQAIEKYDYSRPIKLKYDYKGNFQDGTRWRPLQISVWYPTKRNNSSKMLFKDYYALTTTEKSFDRILSQTEEQKEIYKNFENRIKSYYLANSDSLGRDKILNIKMAAVKNASAKQGTFPLIIMTQNNGDSPFNQSLIAEYLASHGYIVASTISTTKISPQDDFVEQEAKDIEFIINQMYEFPNVDKDKLAIYAVGLGGMSGGKVLFRNTEIDALISIESGFATPQGVQGIKKVPEYIFAKNRNVPLMHMYRVRKDPADFTIMNSFKYTDRYMIEMKALRHFNFSTIGMVASLFPGYVSNKEWIIGGEKAKIGYRILGEYVLNFLNAYLLNDKKAIDFLNTANKEGFYANQISSYNEVKAIEPTVPSESEFAKVMMTQGIDAALQIYNEARKQNPDLVMFSENSLIGVGYFGFLNKGKTKEAIKVFKLVTEAFPKSWNGFDSLAEAYMADGQKNLAITNFRKSLRMNPSNNNAKEKLKELNAG